MALLEERAGLASGINLSHLTGLSLLGHRMATLALRVRAGLFRKTSVIQGEAFGPVVSGSFQALNHVAN